MALGGHVSKIHPNQSSEYKRKMATRKARTAHRVSLELAKEWYRDNIGLDLKKNRVKITRVKDELMEGKQP